MMQNPEEIDNTSITNQTYQRIYSMIIQGDLKPGSKLKIEELRRVMGTGASPIREALSLLTSEQLVTRIDQRGFRVSHVSAESFKELLKTRCWLEERALRESMACQDINWEERLLLSHHRLKREPRMLEDKKTINPDWERRHKEFHMCLMSGCVSTILIKFCNQLYDQNIRYRNAAGSIAYSSRDVTSEHDLILKYVLDHNPDKAVAELVTHYKKTGEFLALQLN